MSLLRVRKIVLFAEDTLLESGQVVSPALRKVVAAAVIENPFAGRYVEDLAPLFPIGEELGAMLAARAVAALETAPHGPQSYGKAAIVGSNGELEHCAALLHPQLGRPLRAAVGGGKAVIPSAKKRGGPGTAIDVPLHHKDDEWRFDNFDAVEIRIVDAPAANEIVVAVAVSSGGRPLPRIGSARR